MEMQELPRSQTEEAFYKSGSPGEALLPEVQGYEDNTELLGERYGSQDGSPGCFLEEERLSLGFCFWNH